MAEKFPTEITKIQLKTKTTDTSNDMILLDRGEPLFIPESNELRIGQKDNTVTSTANDAFILSPTQIKVGAIGTTSDSKETNGAVYIKLVEDNGTVKSKKKIEGKNAVEVRSGSTGNIYVDADFTLSAQTSEEQPDAGGSVDLILTDAIQKGTDIIKLQGSDNLSVAYSESGEEKRILLSGTASVKVVTITDNKTDTKALGPGTDNSIGIVKRLITDGISGGKDPYQYTAYVHNGTDWCAMDGNYSAENVYFSEDFVVTEDFGTTKVSAEEPYKTVEATGKSVQQLFKEQWSTKTSPTVTQPSLALSASTQAVYTDSSTYEIGSKVEYIDYNTTFSQGKYSYGAIIDGVIKGPSDGPQLSNITYEVTDGNSNITKQTTSRGTKVKLINPVSLDTLSSKTIATITAKVNYTAPSNVQLLDSKGDVDSSVSPISSGYKYKTETITVTPYRVQYFYGGINTKITTSNSDTWFTSSNIRSNCTSSGASKQSTFTFSVQPGDASIVIVVLGDVEKLKKVYNATVNADMTDNFIKVTGVSVQGCSSNTSATYTAFYYSPAETYTTSAVIEVEV